MKIKVVLITENDAEVGNVPKAVIEEAALRAWTRCTEMLTKLSSEENGDRAYVESCELLDELDCHATDAFTPAYNPIQRAYDLMVGYHHEGKPTDLDEVIGYLGEALED